MRVFVYGTLKAGFRNAGFLSDATFVGKAVTPPSFTMFDYTAGGFPIVTKGGNVAIKGEVYEISDSVLRQLDALEGHPIMYKRQLEETSLGEAWVYLMPREKCEGLNEVQSGNWR